MSKTKIIYKDVAPGAAEAATPEATAAAEFSNLALLPFGADTPAVATLEHSRWALDGSFETHDEQEIAFWSSVVSDKSTGVFAAPPVITLTFSQQFSAVGITLTSDVATDERCSGVTVQWYQGETLKAEADFEPNDATYFCQQAVEAFDKIVLTLNKTSVPGRRARINSILIGIVREFGMDELRDAEITAETSLIGTELPAGALKWTLESRKDIDYMFQLKQPVEAVSGGKLIGVYYIDKAKRQGANTYQIECQDAIGVLDDDVFAGGMYTDKSAKELAAEIIGGAFDLTIDAEDTQVTGYIPEGTRRDALQQLLFVWGVCALTTGVTGVHIYSPGTELTDVGTGRTYTGPTVETAAITTSVQVTAHQYTADASGDIEVGGQKYKDTTTVYTVTNPNVTANTKANVVQITDATLVSPAVGQAVAQRVYDYYARRKTASSKIVWQGEQPGAYLSVPDGWGTQTVGHAEKMTLKLSNTIAADIDLKGV